MKVLIVEPGKQPRKADIPHTLESMQKTVGGYIEAICPWEDAVALVCDEEGLLKGAPINRMIAPDFGIFGAFFICGIGSDDFVDLTDEMADKYSRMFEL